MNGKSILIACLLLVLAACNSGGGLGGLAGGGIGGSGVTDVNVGPISSFGSIFVNGVEFDTSEAVIIVNGQQMTLQDLQVGMVVRVESSTDAGSNRAVQVDFNENVRGPVQAIDDETLTVLGQTVIVDRFTVFDGDLDELQINDVINVSGLVEADGVIRATWMAVENGLREFELVGSINNLNQADQTFTLGGITVDYNSVSRLEVAELQNGLLVEVKGLYIDERLTATAIIEETLQVAAGTDVEIEGFVTDFTNATAFRIDQFAATTNAQTLFRFGTVNDLAAGARVEVEGQLNADGVIELEEVVFLDIASQRTPAGRIDIEAEIEAVDGNIVTLLGLPITTTQSTQFRDRRDDVVPYGLAQLQVSDRVEVSGFLDLSTDDLIAEVLVRKSADEEGLVSIVGPVDNLNAEGTAFTILGIQVLTDEDTVYEDETLDGVEVIIDAGLFLPNIQKSLIEVEGLYLGEGVILAKSLETED